jgi:serine/threonine protein kinase/tetratricopeptide (TPR) repeat protein
MSTVGRYEELRRLGSGATSDVFLARDRQDGQLVALKRMRAQVPATTFARMRREFRALGRLTHPGVVRVVDFGTDEGVPYLVMEFVAGVTLTRWLESHPYSQNRTPETLRDVLRVFAALAEVFAYIHQSGIVHRDLKPENVSVLPNGQVKLMDFGLVKHVTSGHDESTMLTQAGALVGTVAFVAPEQARGQPVDYRTDLYAFGVMLYWAVVGHLPFRGSVIKVISAHLTEAPPDPRLRAPFLPAELAELILQLLAKERHERPGSAFEVASKLRLLAGLEALPERNQPLYLPSARADALLDAPLIGRSNEYNQLLAWILPPATLAQMAATSAPISQPADKRPRLLRLEGPMGVGKTALLREVVGDLEVQGWKVFIANAVEGTPDTYALFSQLWTLLRATDPGRLARIASEDQTELSRLNNTRVVAQNHELPPDVAQMQMFGTVARAWEAMSDHQTLWVFENLHHADSASLGLLAHCLRQKSVRVLVTYRNDELGSEARGVLSSLLRHLTSATLTLEPLRASDLAALIEAWLGGQVDGLQALLEEGKLERRSNSQGQVNWQWRESSLDLGTNARGVVAVLQRRLAILSPLELEFAQMAAVLGPRFSFEDAAQLAGDEDSALTALEGLVRARIVLEDALPQLGLGGSQNASFGAMNNLVGNVSGGTVNPNNQTLAGVADTFSFAQPLLVPVLRERLGRGQRQRLHARAAEVLSGRASDLTLAQHYAQAEQGAKALAHALRAAESAWAIHDADTTEAAYRLALNFAPPAQRSRLARRRGQALRHSGRIGEALEAFERASNEGGDEANAARLDLALLHHAGGDLDSAMVELAPLFLPKAQIEHSLKADALHLRARLLRDLGRAAEARISYHEALGELELAENFSGLALAQTGLAMIEEQENNIDASESLFALAARTIGRVDDPLPKAMVWNNIGLYHQHRRRYGPARQALETALEIFVRLGHIFGEGVARSNLGALEVKLGRFAEAERQLELAAHIAVRTDNQGERMVIEMERAALEYWRGDLKAALARLEVTLASVPNGSAVVVARICRWIARVSVALGAAERAAEILAKAAEPIAKIDSLVRDARALSGAISLLRNDLAGAASLLTMAQPTPEALIWRGILAIKTRDGVLLKGVVDALLQSAPTELAASIIWRDPCTVFEGVLQLWGVRSAADAATLHEALERLAWSPHRLLLEEANRLLQPAARLQATPKAVQPTGPESLALDDLVWQSQSGETSGSTSEAEGSTATLPSAKKPEASASLLPEDLLD